MLMLSIFIIKLIQNPSLHHTVTWKNLNFGLTVWNSSTCSSVFLTLDCLVLQPHDIFLVLNLIWFNFANFYFEFNGFSTSNFNSCTASDRNQMIQISSQWHLGLIHTLFVKYFTAMGSSSFNPHAQFLVHSPQNCIKSPQKMSSYDISGAI